MQEEEKNLTICVEQKIFEFVIDLKVSRRKNASLLSCSDREK